MATAVRHGIGKDQKRGHTCLLLFFVAKIMDGPGLFGGLKICQGHLFFLKGRFGGVSVGSRRWPSPGGNLLATWRAKKAGGWRCLGLGLGRHLGVAQN